MSSLLTFVIVIYYLLIVSLCITILLQNSNPHKTNAYLIALLLIPLIGLLIYVFFGQNYRKEKLFSRKGITDSKQLLNWSKKQVLEFSQSHEPISKLLGEKIKIVKMFAHNEGAVLTQKNRVEVLTNGENTFPKIIEDLRKAKHHIHLEYYIFCDDPVGSIIKGILIDKAKQGVEVRFIFDGVGSSLKNSFVKELRRSGIEIYAFMPVMFSNFTSKANYRNHRKIIVIDGKIGFIGGINIDERYINDGKDKVFWRDTHLRIEGEAVKSMQALFLLNWKFVSGDTINLSKEIFPTSRITENKLIQVVGSGPDSDYASIMYAYFMAITIAKNYIYISTPYFIPNEEIMTGLITSALSGIDVQLIVPERCDSWIVDAATHSFFEKLLEAGVKIYFYKKGFIHAKVMIVDDLFATIGTANMDYRSFDINFEVNALIYDKDVTKRLMEDYIEDRENSEQLLLERWNNRSFTKMLTESFARTMSPLL